MVSKASAAGAGMKLDEASRTLKSRGKRRSLLAGGSRPPPADWMKPGFDDADWNRVQGPYTTGRQEVGLLCRRAKFRVNDPAAVARLTLELGYRGGVVVYLNGREVLRESLPAGELAEGTPGADYPLGAFLVAEGERQSKLLHSWYDRKLTKQFALRERAVGPVELPLDALRKGVNVLAIASHSSRYPAECMKLGVGEFAAVGLTKLFLRAGAKPGAIVPAVTRPAGVQVWNAEITEEVHELSYGDPCEALGPIRIAAVGNGRFSGQVVLSSTDEIAGLSCKVGSLTAGGASIPASSVQVRFGQPTKPMRYIVGSVYGGPTGVAPGVRFRRFDALADAPPRTVLPHAPAERLRTDVRREWGLPDKPVAAAIVPIWVTVSVPAGAKAGTYKGTLAISAAGLATRAVPIELEVFGWSLPDVADYVSQFSVYQSPDTLAAYYKTPLWSERHWELIDRSVRLIGEASNHTIIIPLLSKEQVGNEQSYIRWIKRPDGSFDYDTSVMDKYLDVYLKHHDPRRIQAVCMIVWGNAGVARGNPYQKDKYDERGLPKRTRGKFTVTLLDRATGAAEDMVVPAVGTDEYEAFWRPVLGKAREALRRRKLAEKMLLGMPADPHPVVAAVKAFHNILPDVGWYTGNHPGATKMRYHLTDRTKTVPVIHAERVYTGPLPDPARKRQFGWRRKQMALAFNRYGFGPLCLYPNPSVWAFRMLMEADLASGHRGAGRIGADYWQMPGVKSRSGGAGTFYARYPDSAIGQTGMAANCADLLGAAPDGPVTTARFENVREGIQNAEAVISIQKALLAERVTGELARRCWKALDERVNAMRTYTMGIGRAGWQQRDRRLYQAAADVAGALKGQ